MEKNQEEHIMRNYDLLVRRTICTELLYSGLLTREVLSTGDVENIKAKETPSAKSFELYRILLTRKDAYIPFIKTLADTGQTGAANILREILSPSQLQRAAAGSCGGKVKRVPRRISEPEQAIIRKKSFESKTILSFDVLSPSALFTGREDDLQTLHASILADEKSDSELTTVGGLGGMGKTELARRYLELYSELFHYVVWILAETLDSTTQSLRRLCTDKLDIPTKNSNGDEKSMKSLLEDVLQLLKGSKTLFVLDNAEKEEHVTTFLQAVRALKQESEQVDKIHILITSRNTDWGTKQPVNLREMNLPDAVNFVKKGLQRAEGLPEQEHALIEKLVTTLQCFPLAIQQAISYIINENEKRSYGIPAYLEAFETKDSARRKLLNAPPSQHKHLVDYTRTTYTTWEMTLDKISTFEEEGELALRILNVMAYLVPDNIPRSMFLPLSGEDDEDEELVSSAVDLLVKYSMIYGEEKQSMLRLHRLVQHVTRLRLGGKNEVSVLEDAFAVVDVDGGGQGQIDISTVGHSISVWNHAVKHDKLVSLHSDFPVKVVQCLNNNFRYADSAKFGLSAEQQLIPVVSAESQVIHNLTCSTIDALTRSGDYLHAIQLCDKKLLPSSPNDHLEEMDLKLRKGYALFILDKFDDALPLAKEAFELRKEYLGPDHKSTKIALFVYTRVSVSLGRFETTLLNMDEVTGALEVFKPEDNEDWYYYFNAQSAVGVYYISKGRYATAKGILEKLYSYRLGNNSSQFERHPQVINGGYNLAVLLNKLGEHEEAYEIIKEVKAVQESVLGAGHRNVLLAKQAIGACLNGLGRLSEALEVQQEVYDALSAHPQYGQGSVWTLFSKLSIGISWYLLGRHEEGSEAIAESVSKMEAIFTESHDEIFQVKLQLAKAYARAGDVTRARESFQEVYTKILDRHGELHEDLPRIRAYLEELELRD